MTPPPWEVADIIRRAGDKFFERYRDSLTWNQLKVLRANRALPHGRTRWASRSMRSLWASGHLVPLLPQPALPEVPDQCQGEVVVRPATGTVAGWLLPPGLQRAARAGAVDLAKPEVSIRTLVRGQRRNPAGSCGRSGSPRCRDRLPQHSAYRGTDSAATPAPPLCRTGWLHFTTNVEQSILNSVALTPSAITPLALLQRMV